MMEVSGSQLIWCNGWSSVRHKLNDCYNVSLFGVGFDEECKGDARPSYWWSEAVTKYKRRVAMCPGVSWQGRHHENKSENKEGQARLGTYDSKCMDNNVVRKAESHKLERGEDDNIEGIECLQQFDVPQARSRLECWKCCVALQACDQQLKCSPHILDP